jgi:pimeloyl-ACP methyl ester carboxylesterase
MGADAHIAHLGDRMKIAAERIRHDGLDVWVSAYWSKNPPFSRHSQIRLPGIFDRYKTMLLNNNPENYIETCMAIANAEDLTDELHQIQAPALVIAGLEDDRTSAAASRTLATKLPNARLVELPEVGHTMALEAPLDVAHRIDDFATSVFSNLVSGSLSA